ncbi:MAG: hypothetical protein ACM33V_07895, partial [Chloroflexota bacterium]|nr:hypothetical protein [Anaerolineales bacterium]
PLAVSMQILFQHLYPLAASTSSNETLEQVRDIQKRLLELKRRLQYSRSREGVRLIDRLQRLVHQADETLQEY